MANNPNDDRAERAQAWRDAIHAAALAVADARERLGFVRAKAIAIEAEEQHARALVRQMEQLYNEAFAELGGGGADVKQP